MKFVNVMGVNAIGKSTRVTTLVDFLGDNFQEISYEFVKKTRKNPEGEQKSIKNIGRYYPEQKFFILGRMNNSGVWVGLDTADLNSWDAKEEFYNWIIYHSKLDIDVYIQEGYFNNLSKRGRPNFMIEHGFTSVEMFFFIYDDIMEFVERCSGRTGKNKTVEWATTSPGWKDNEGYKKGFIVYSEQNNEVINVMKFTKDAPKDLFVQHFFNENHEIVQKQEEKKEILDLF